MKKGAIVSGQIVRVDYPNKGIMITKDEATGETREVVVKNALPGQTVSARILKMRHGRPEGQLLEVTAPAPNEKTVEDGLCPHFGVCGGCCYRSLPYEDELAMKEAQIRRLLDSVVDTPYEYEPITHGPQSTEFRNKMEFSFGDEYKDGPLSLGLHKRNSMYDIVPVMKCQMIDLGMQQILRATLGFYQKKGLPYYHKIRHEGVLRHLLLRKSFSEGGYMVALVTTGETADLDLPGYVDHLLALPVGDRIRGILHMVNDSVADTVASQKTTVLYGTDYLTESLLGLQFKISPFSFFQTNSLGAEVLYRVARSFVGETQGRTVFDLYSGTGTIAQMLAPVARHVIGVEIVEEAVQAARENARLNGLSNCTFIAGDVLKKLDEIEERPDFIVLDPPRDGVHPKALEKIIAYGVENMIYISCKPTSLIRDLEILQANGYRVVRARAVDMFPGTAHVETVALLTRGQATHSMNLHPEPYEMIQSGQKTIELRLFDEKRRKIRPGDTIEFTNTATGETLRTRVVKLHRFASFDELYQALPLLQCGYTEADIAGAKPSDMDEYYSVEEQQKYGVVGIELTRDY